MLRFVGHRFGGRAVSSAATSTVATTGAALQTNAVATAVVTMAPALVAGASCATAARFAGTSSSSKTKDIGRVSQPKKKTRKTSPKPKGGAKAKSVPAALASPKGSKSAKKGVDLARVSRPKKLGARPPATLEVEAGDEEKPVEADAPGPAPGPGPAEEMEDSSPPGPSPPVPQPAPATPDPEKPVSPPGAPEGSPGAGDKDVPAVPAAHAGSISRASLLFKAPKLAREYMPENPVAVGQLSCDSPMPVLWQCRACAHKWSQSPFVRHMLKAGCPSCAKEDEEPLSVIAPSLGEELHPVKNDPFLTADRLTVKHRAALWWRCSSCQGEFQSRIRSRLEAPLSRGACPFCTVTVNSAAKEVLEREWHPTKNGDMQLMTVLSAPTGTTLSRAPVWWICPSCAIEWQAPSHARLRGHGMCPSCNPERAGISGRGMRKAVIASGSD